MSAEDRVRALEDKHNADWRKGVLPDKEAGVLAANHCDEMRALAWQLVRKLEVSESVRNELSVIVACTSPDGSAELGQVRYMQGMITTMRVERELLGIFTEEMGEALQVIGKIMRHGWSPEHEGVKYNNLADLEREMGDVRAAMIRLCAAGVTSKEKIHQRAEEKLAPGGTIIRWCMPYAKPF